MRCRYFSLLLLCSTTIAQDYHKRCPDQQFVISRASPPSLDTFYTTANATFMIHYDTLGVHAPHDMSDENLNRIPDYVESIGTAADSAKFILNNVMEFEEVTLDEDDMYDIYIYQLSTGYWGKCESVNGDHHNPSYISLRNSYSDLSDRCNNLEDLVWLTVGHEYFHAVQLEYRILTHDPYFKEFTSMWFENIFVPDCFDFLDFTSPLFNSPEKNFDSQPNSGSHGYSLALYGHYLGRIVDVSGAENEMNGTIMNQIWEEYKNGGDAIDAVDDVLDEYYEGKSFIETWIDFMSRNLYCGIYDNMENDFYYHAGQEYIDPIQTSPILISDSIRIELDLDYHSAAIQSYKISGINSIFTINHHHNNFIGRIAIVSTANQEKNNLIWALDPTITESYSDVKIHFVYGVEGSSMTTLPIDLLVSTVPLPPSSLRATAAQDSIILYWSPSPGPGDNLHYIIYRDADSIYTNYGTTYVDYVEGLQEYTYQVTSVNEIVDGESQPSNSVTIQSWPEEDDVTANQILSIYPNPIHKTIDSHILYALGLDYSNITLELINIQGQIVKTVALQYNQQGWHREKINSLVSSKLAAGIYFIRLRPNNIFGSTQKITILP